MKKGFKYVALSVMAGSLLAFSTACGNGADKNGTEKTSEEQKQLSGEVAIDGSSTVFPIMEAVSEEYAAEQPDVKAPVGVSGTGGGFKKFVVGETDLSNASRPIKDEEKQLAEQNKVEFTEFEIAKDGLTVVVNKDNDWAKDLTVEDLQKMWLEDGTTKKWSDINPKWPNEEIKFYSPGTDSGTYDYFDEVILEEKPLVKTATLSEDDNVLVTGVSGDKYAIGFFGYAYYLENKDKINAVKINGVEPNNKTVESGEYSPLSRPLFVYVNNASIKEKDYVYDYMKFALENAGALAEEVGYVKLPQNKYDEQMKKLEGLKK
ncbi:PstS family phosphate ABC transporter substrate-binding protein [Bacillus sp. 165]|uniref:PstS family phosphate ABC transporter substrate-binding protein n=1 Tax=Bacillus sp. 165 TaxID=1529117 RepID=UPI001ADB0B23|nr:PstS family phosphate ABC transporter substrate-binding protein [Bacillus sp. 165]MBO9129628.1 PstS family phosphate ABC transporter substrate-binding protein [Bacillus sp. 165]